MNGGEQMTEDKLKKLSDLQAVMCCSCGSAIGNTTLDGDRYYCEDCIMKLNESLKMLRKSTDNKGGDEKTQSLS